MSEKPCVIDLFAGVGGLSLGASRAGFNVSAAVEIDKHAVTAHHQNFPNTRLINKDIQSFSAEELLDAANLKQDMLAGLIGGPPCQGFSTIGRRIADDPRNSLFTTFFELVASLRPGFFVAENVPGILNNRNDSIRNAALAKVPQDYVVLPALTIKASDYGAPTTRTRVFFIGYDPQRIFGLSKDDFLPTAATQDVRVADALKGIPNLGTYWETHEGWQYVEEPDDTYFASRLKGHIPLGVGDKTSLKFYQESGLVSGFLPTAHNPSTIARFDLLEHGKADKISKCVRLDPKGYCPTLRAGTGPEKGSFQAIRPVHPSLPRVICPREAARLQGFPDWFQFDNTKWHAFRQIGNSVSPIVAEVILGRIFSAIKS